MWSWSTNVTDRRTDRRTTCNLNTALCTSAARGKNYTFSLLHSGSSPILPLKYHWNFCIGFFPKDASFLQSSAYRPFKVIQGRKRVWYFLLVRHSNQALIISDMLQIFGWKLQIFPILLTCGGCLRVFYLELRGEVYHEETSHGAILQWRPHDRSLSHFDKHQRVTDRQIDGWTDLLQLVCAVKSISYVTTLVQSNSLFMTLKSKNFIVAT